MGYEFQAQAALTRKLAKTDSARHRQDVRLCPPLGYLGQGGIMFAYSASEKTASLRVKVRISRLCSHIFPPWLALAPWHTYPSMHHEHKDCRTSTHMLEHSTTFFWILFTLDTKLIGSICCTQKILHHCSHSGCPGAGRNGRMAEGQSWHSFDRCSKHTNHGQEQ